MEPDFWHERWKNNEIGFHSDAVNPYLIRYFHQLSLNPGARILVPLCGKSLDLHWFLDQGFQVVGVELSELAVEQLFHQLNARPSIVQHSHFKHYQAPGIDIWCGDLFNLTQAELGAVDGIYDRAALVALPETIRPQYTDLLVSLTGAVPQLLVSFDYDQNLLPGPPFSVNADYLTQYYAAHYRLTRLASEPVIGGLKGRSDVLEEAWLLQPDSIS